ncbi:MAG: sulfopyruvate decarboxylase subunit beta [Chloroflexi bacterium]|nr:sulfopyruvate decarboxylase subunit beta [Chloroflexota bacterium]MCI0798149.1 sulfopyruvate decarboxylase subunit beta [Chloroflexota bacterium]MCI0858309.1 sulfopyruvate decarboxylase subunit beta [Chloroflexota bacterium]MCI0865992.1 sulfopyruvate decarboxylase subunit beta [Chloroflexota bacterium]
MIDRIIAIETILNRVKAGDSVLSTTGMISREVFVTDDRPGNFYMIGSMGLLSSFGLGLAIMSPQQRVLVLEGDGSSLMSLGNMPIIATERPSNLIHVILDNEAYESTGSQPSISSKVDLAQIGKSCGYAHAVRVEDVEALEGALSDCDTNAGPHLILVKAGIAPVEGIPRVSHSPTTIRDRFKAATQSGGQVK